VPSAHAGQVLLPVPRVTIYPGQVIEQGMLVERAFLSGTAEQAVATSSSGELIGKVARQTLLPGRPVSQAALRQPHAITQGQSALVIFQSGALTITGNAIALQSGATGDMVSVRNTDSGRIIKGTIGSDGAVHVGGP
jgi:flagella basal body P-ring formation protein FlgA